MAISIDWGNTNVISVPQADLTLVSGTLYDFDTDAFRLELKDLEESVEGMPFPDTHVHNTEITLSGTIYARFVEVISPYSITFEDTGSAYTVRSIGSNNNVFDEPAGILNPTPLVSYISTNSAGLIIAETGTSGLTPTESQALLDIDTNVDALIVDTAALETKIDTLLLSQDLTNEQAAADHTTDPATGKLVLRNFTTVERWEADAWEDAAQTIPYRGRVAGIEESGGLESVGQLTQVDWPYTLLSLTYGETLGVTDTEAGNGDVVFPFDSDISHMTEFTDGSDSTWLNAVATGAGGTAYVSTIGSSFTPDSFIGHKVYLRFKGVLPGNLDAPAIDGTTTLVSCAALVGSEGPIVPEASTDTEWRDILLDVSEALAIENAATGPVIFAIASNGATYAGSPIEIKVASIEYRIPNMTTVLWP